MISELVLLSAVIRRSPSNVPCAAPVGAPAAAGARAPVPPSIWFSVCDISSAIACCSGRTWILPFALACESSRFNTSSSRR